MFIYMGICNWEKSHFNSVYIHNKIQCGINSGCLFGFHETSLLRCEMLRGSCVVRQIGHSRVQGWGDLLSKLCKVLATEH